MAEGANGSRPAPAAVDAAVARHVDLLRTEVEEKLAAMEDTWRKRCEAVRSGYQIQLASLHGVCRALQARYRAAKAAAAQGPAQEAVSAPSYGIQAQWSSNAGGEEDREAYTRRVRAEIERACADEFRQRCEAERARMEAEFESRCQEHVAMVREDMRSATERRLRAALMERLKPAVEAELRRSMAGGRHGASRGPRRSRGGGEPEAMRRQARAMVTEAPSGIPRLAQRPVNAQAAPAHAHVPVKRRVRPGHASAQGPRLL